MSGLAVINTEECWDLPVPCTPYFRRELRLRESGNLASGFILDQPAREYVDMHGYDLPPVVSAPASLGILMAGDWYPYESVHGICWMGDEGVILLYSDTPRRLQLALQPYSILGPAGGVEYGRLSVAVEGVHLTTVEVRVGEAATLPLTIQPGFTRVTLRLEGGAHVLAELLPGSQDTRRLSIAVSRIELRDE